MKSEQIKEYVRKAYTEIVKNSRGCGCGPSCCGSNAYDFTLQLGYQSEDLSAVPMKANLALSCGNPVAAAALKPGEIVLDLGCGAGFDCFLAAQKVGPTGRVIGVDMTPAMIEQAQKIAHERAIQNVEFRLGEIENLPLDSNAVDVVISNCVINLAVAKAAVFSEIYRVLKPGGRLAIADTALFKELPKALHSSFEAYTGCISGALQIEEYEALVQRSGFRDVNLIIERSLIVDNLRPDDPIGQAVMNAMPDGQSLEQYLASVLVEAYK
ncbi:MAG: arsenite methyltransferase [candidate division KSB1 bacterium]|nr:arsenite methyltransferase [candidate division KSB1 bacterium]